MTTNCWLNFSGVASGVTRGIQQELLQKSPTQQVGVDDLPNELMQNVKWHLFPVYINPPTTRFQRSVGNAELSSRARSASANVTSF